MWRESAVRGLLLEEICSLPRVDASDSTSSDRSESDRLLSKALQRGHIVVALDWLALLVLLVLRSPGQEWLPFGPTEASIFTLGILILAIHSGFRLGQLEKLRSVRRTLSDLEERASGA